MIELYVGVILFILTAVGGTMAFFLKRMIEGFDKKLDMIDNKIEFLVVRTTTADGDIADIKDDITDIYTVLDRHSEQYSDLHTRITKIETAHEPKHAS